MPGAPSDGCPYRDLRIKSASVERVQPKKLFWGIAFREPDRLQFEVLGLVGVNSYAVPQAAGGFVRKKTP